MSREQAYVAIHPKCGMAVAAAVFDTEHPERASREVSRWQRYKMQPEIKLLPLEEARALLFCGCDLRRDALDQKAVAR